MALVDVVRSQMMAAMKAKDASRKDVLSHLLAALKDGVIKKRADLTEEDSICVQRKCVKNFRA